MTVVSDSGPLISLARIGQLELLPALYGEVLIPPAVQREISGDSTQTGAQELAQASWLRVVEVEDQAAAETLRFSLDQGESEAITLARQLQALLLIDERRGRAIATRLGLEKTGTVGLLLAAKRNGLIKTVTPLLDALLAAGVRLSPRLYEEARRLAGED